MFIVFQEKEGQFGVQSAEQVINACKTFKNLVITCSTSGKVHNLYLNLCYQYCIRPVIGNHKCLLILDGLSSHKNFKDLIEKNEEIDLDMMIYPPHVTGQRQPLDKLWNGPFKLVYRRIITYSVLSKLKFNEKFIAPHLRIYQMLCLSFVYEQFRAPLFRGMGNVAWVSCGFEVIKEVREWEDGAKEILFKFTEGNCETVKCQDGKTVRCQNSTFIRCSHCRMNLWF